MDKFATKKNSELNPSPSEASSMGDKMSNVSFSNSVSMVKSKEEKIIQGSDRTYISLGRDRPGEIGTGNEFEPAGAIYVCAGASYGIPEADPTNKEGLILNSNRNFNIDASSIYASANCNIDEYFGIVPGSMGNPENSAAIAVKSTNLRFVARNGIKLVTRTDISNESGAPLDSSISGIEIIAGNDDEDLQPMVKGQSLVDALEDLTDQIFEIVETLEHFLKQQADFNQVLAKHTHPDALNMLVGLFTGGPTSISKGRTLEDPETKLQGTKTNGFIVENMMLSVLYHKTNIELFKKQFLSNEGEDYINSRYNKVN